MVIGLGGWIRTASVEANNNERGGGGDWVVQSSIEWWLKPSSAAAVFILALTSKSNCHHEAILWNPSQPIICTSCGG